MNIKAFAAAAAMVTVSACATRPAPAPATTPGQGFSASADALPSAREKKILDLLSSGDLAPAKVEAQALVAERPDDREAAVLLMEIEQDPKALLGALNFDVQAKAGDSFAGLAERYLHDRALAYALARYNGVTPPNQPTAGQTVQIPGSPAQVRGEARGEAPPRRREAAEPRTPRLSPAAEKPAAEKPAADKQAPEKPTSTSAPETPPKPPAPPKPAEPPKPAAPPHDPAKAASLRSDALVLMNKGDIDHAVGLLRQAAALDPDSAPIKTDLDRAQRIQHGAH